MGVWRLSIWAQTSPPCVSKFEGLIDKQLAALDVIELELLAAQHNSPVEDDEDGDDDDDDDQDEDADDDNANYEADEEELVQLVAQY